MRKSKLITTLLISTLALSSVLTACGSKKNTSENETELVTEVETQSLQSEAGANIEGTNLEGLTFNQSVSEDSSEVKNLLTNSGVEYSDVILYDFNLTDANNEKVQPDGSVTITFTPELANPNREGATSTYAVYYYDDENGTISPMETTSNGDEVTFTTTHFSYYALARAIHVTNEDGTTSLLEYVDDEGNYLTWNEKEELRAKKEQEAMEAAEKEEAKKAQANSSTTSSSSGKSGSTSSSSNSSSGSSSASTTAYFDRAAAESLWASINAERTAAGVPAMEWNETAYAYACERAQELVTDYSHNGNNESYNEIIAMRYDTNFYTAFKNSSSHHNNYMSSSNTKGACAVYYCNGWYYCAGDFYSSGSSVGANYVDTYTASNGVTIHILENGTCGCFDACSTEAMMAAWEEYKTLKGIQ
ncbi:CAP domain-containing protein [Lachnospira pectinoschiza]|uniref:Uncharacterized conserved protein YkwD, contains CAP (CSP/antigen 5/PR1) domain n=1 Tax=Lachnospira pectinoschiza TaxID=28052 RepID=A0A1G9VBT3_9FIRM|nr:CAP domain-containing protein [Lachnospira pectinoschiza]SDM69581.1 Uncharacterized conserved protein YkwD, contains CAP (CSP/antigen 5/PR1) domain [Lachnospira pectinoschiza]